MIYHIVRLALISALVVWCFQVGQRIRFGDWIWVTPRALMGNYYLEALMPWRTGAKMVGWVLDLPLGWLLVAVGALLLVVQLWRETRAHQRKMDQENKRMVRRDVFPS
jgi:hypothetical protein